MSQLKEYLLAIERLKAERMVETAHAMRAAFMADGDEFKNVCNAMLKEPGEDGSADGGIIDRMDDIEQRMKSEQPPTMMDLPVPGSPKAQVGEEPSKTSDIDETLERW